MISYAYAPCVLSFHLNLHCRRSLLASYASQLAHPGNERSPGIQPKPPSNRTRHGLYQSSSFKKPAFLRSPSQRSRSPVMSTPTDSITISPVLANKSSATATLAPFSLHHNESIAVAQRRFLVANPLYNQTSPLDQFRRREFKRLKTTGAYLDYTGAGLYPESLVREHAELLSKHVLGNPHSASPRFERSSIPFLVSSSCC